MTISWGIPLYIGNNRCTYQIDSLAVYLYIDRYRCMCCVRFCVRSRCLSSQIPLRQTAAKFGFHPHLRCSRHTHVHTDINEKLISVTRAAHQCLYTAYALMVSPSVLFFLRLLCGEAKHIGVCVWLPQQTMQDHAAVFRTGEVLKEGVEMMKDVAKSFADIGIKDRSLSW